MEIRIYPKKRKDYFILVLIGQEQKGLLGMKSRKIRTIKTNDNKYIKYLEQYGIYPLFKSGEYSYFDRQGICLFKHLYERGYNNART